MSDRRAQRPLLGCVTLPQEGRPNEKPRPDCVKKLVPQFPTAFRCFELRAEILGLTGRRFFRSPR
jgi:hypothetical protein